MEEIKYKSEEWYEDKLHAYQLLQALVLTFHKKYKNELSEDIKDKYIKYFGITTIREGRV